MFLVFVRKTKLLLTMDAKVTFSYCVWVKLWFYFSSVVVVCFSLFRFCFLETGFSFVALAALEHSQ